MTCCDDEGLLVVPLRSDYQGYVLVKKRHPTSGKVVPAAGLTGVKMYFSLTKGGAAIDAEVEWPLTELSGQAGGYLGILAREFVDEHLEPLGVGRRLWRATVGTAARTTWRECMLVHDES